MKRLLSISAMMVVAATLSYTATAQTTVTSVNVVGFQVNDVLKDKPLSLVAFPFVAIDSDQSITNLLGGQLTPGSNVGDADTISFWDAGAQSYQRVYRSVFNGNEWADSSNPFGVTTQELFIGRAFWVRSNNGAADQVLNMSGEIVTDNTVTQQVIAGLNLLSYPYNAEVSMTNTTLSASMTPGSNLGDSDTISIWDVDTQSYIRYYRSVFAGNQWAASSDPFTPVDLKIQMGQGFWLNRQAAGAFTWTETKPYSL